MTFLAALVAFLATGLWYRRQNRAALGVLVVALILFTREPEGAIAACAALTAAASVIVVLAPILRGRR
jgi:hypothetical protein